jgi:hypothetical protein
MSRRRRQKRAAVAENVASHKGVRHRVSRVAAEFQAFFATLALVKPSCKNGVEGTRLTVGSQIGASS